MNNLVFPDRDVAALKISATFVDWEVAVTVAMPKLTGIDKDLARERTPRKLQKLSNKR